MQFLPNLALLLPTSITRIFLVQSLGLNRGATSLNSATAAFEITDAGLRLVLIRFLNPAEELYFRSCQGYYLAKSVELSMALLQWALI